MDIMSGQKYALTGQILGRPDTLSGSFTLLMNQILFKFIEIHVCHNKLFGIVWQRGVSKQNRCNWNLTGASRKIISSPVFGISFGNQNCNDRLQGNVVGNCWFGSGEFPAEREIWHQIVACILYYAKTKSSLLCTESQK